MPVLPAAPERPAGGRLGARGAPLLIVAAAFSVQGGAALATTIFEQAGPLGAVLLRVGFAALLLPVVALALGRRLRRPDRTLVLFGLSLAAMNATFYEALHRIPLGVAVTAELVGPLVVAVVGSRRRSDWLWIALAVAGIALLGSPTLDVDPVGLGFALAAGACWAFYIVLGKRVATDGDVVGGLATAMLIAAAVLLPFGLAGGGDGLGDPEVLWRGALVALLSSMVPYVLELAALALIRAATFGILMSLEPAVAAICGAAFIGQGLGGAELVAIALVVAASAGASLRGGRAGRRADSAS